MPPKARSHNRLLVLCTSINDVTAWPFWKFLQMKKIKGVTDMALLAFNSEGGSFEARIDGDKYSMKNFAKVKGYKQEMFQSFLERWHDPGRSYFVYGGHGMGDYLEFEQCKFGLQAHELAGLLDKKHFEAILFDACFMANLDCAYHLRNNTRYIGACEGYMWEPDTALDFHIFNTFTASAMSRFRDPKLILETIQKEYTTKAPRGDFSILDTTHVAELRRFVQDHVMQRVYNHATLYSPAQQERLSLLAEHALEESILQFGQPGGDAYLEGLLTHRQPSSAPATPDTFALANSGRLSRKQRVATAVQFEHALYPSETLDKHLIDLKSYLVDMAAEEEAVEAHRQPRKGSRRPLRKAAAGAWSASRAYDVDAHGALPLLKGEFVPNSQHKLTTSAATTSAEESGKKKGESNSEVSVSLYPPDSARYGLGLFEKVVVSHVPPRSDCIYASRLGGLSVAVHEYSAMSKPVEPWRVSKTILNKKTKAFLEKGSLEEVSMKAQAPALLSSMSSTSSKGAVELNNGVSSGAVLTGAASSSPRASSPVMITCHDAHAVTVDTSGGGGGPSAVSPSLGSNSSGSHNSSSSSSSPSSSSSSPALLAVLPAATRTTTAGPANFLASSSAYSSLSSRSRSYASYSCRGCRGGAAAAASTLSSSSSSTAAASSMSAIGNGTSSMSRMSSSSFSFSSMSSSCCSGNVQEGEGGCVMLSRSADDILEIKRMAMEAAQLLEPSCRC